MEIFNATIKCNMAGHKTDGGYKYESVVINGEDIMTSCKFLIYTKFTFSNVQFLTYCIIISV